MNDQKEPVRENVDGTTPGGDDQYRKQLAVEISFINMGLRRACQTLDDVYSIGQIIKSDGCSDFRQKRDGMIEVRGDISQAIWEINNLRALMTQKDAELDAVKAELEKLLAFVKPIPESISDTMKDTYTVDRKVSEAGERLAPLCDRLDQIKARYKSAE